MKRRMSWYWALPGAVGIALVMTAVLLLLTTTAGKTPTASAAFPPSNRTSPSISPSQAENTA